MFYIKKQQIFWLDHDEKQPGKTAVFYTLAHWFGEENQKNKKSFKTYWLDSCLL